MKIQPVSCSGRGANVIARNNRVPKSPCSNSKPQRPYLFNVPHSSVCPIHLYLQTLGTMSAKAIREYYGKQLMARWLPDYSNGRHTIEAKQVLITPDILEPTKGVSFETIAQANPWLLTDKLVVKPDQLIKRRGKAGLLAVNKTWTEVQAWILERMQREVQVELVKGVLNHFIVEAFVPHKPEEEYYYCIVVSDLYVYTYMYRKRALAT